MAADQCDQPFCMGKKGGSEELAYSPIYRDGPPAEWRGLRILGVGLSALRRAGPGGKDDPDRTYNVSGFFVIGVRSYQVTPQTDGGHADLHHVSD